MDFRCAAKALIIKDKKALILKRRPNDVHKPGKWDIPGGRLEKGENPHDGLKREVKEEAKMDINIILPVEVQHFFRDDGQKIALTIFLCTTQSDNITLSEEHTEYKWLDLETESDQFPDWLKTTIEKINKHELLSAI